MELSVRQFSRASNSVDHWKFSRNTRTSLKLFGFFLSWTWADILPIRLHTGHLNVLWGHLICLFLLPAPTRSMNFIKFAVRNLEISHKLFKLCRFLSFICPRVGVLSHCTPTQPEWGLLVGALSRENSAPKTVSRMAEEKRTKTRTNGPRWIDLYVIPQRETIPFWWAKRQLQRKQLTLAVFALALVVCRTALPACERERQHVCVWVCESEWVSELWICATHFVADTRDSMCVRAWFTLASRLRCFSHLSNSLRSYPKPKRVARMKNGKNAMAHVVRGTPCPWLWMWQSTQRSALSTNGYIPCAYKSTVLVLPHSSSPLCRNGRI